MFPQLHVIIPHTGHSAVGFYIIILMKLPISESQHPQAGIFLHPVMDVIPLSSFKPRTLDSPVPKSSLTSPVKADAS